jgi:sugar phosphate permease
MVPAIFYLSGFYLRVSPAVMTTELMRDFSISASSLGNFSAMYFYAYILMQVPTGVLVDSLGARTLLIAGAVLAAAGTLLFGATSNFYLACLGRVLVGASTAVAWVVTLKIATHWWPSERFALLAGLGLFMGNVGALVAQVPLRLAVNQFEWRGVILASAGVVLAIAVLAWAVVRNDPTDEGYATYAPAALQGQERLTVVGFLKGFTNIFSYRNTWLIFLAQGGFVGSILSFTGLWGPAFLRARFAISATAASTVCSIMIVCWAVASPIFGYLSDRIHRRKPLYLGGAVVAVAGWTVMFYLPGLTLTLFTVVGAVTAFATGAVIIGFPFAKESVPVRFLGTISGAINMGNMVGPTVLQPAIGWVLDRQWSGQLANGLRVYSVDAFQTAFMLIVCWLVVTCLLLAMTTETACRQTT